MLVSRTGNGTQEMIWSAGVLQLCSAFIPLVSICLLSLPLRLAHMQGWCVWEPDDSSVAHLIVA